MRMHSTFLYCACSYWKFFLSAETFLEWKHGFKDIQLAENYAQKSFLPALGTCVSTQPLPTQMPMQHTVASAKHCRGFLPNLTLLGKGYYYAILKCVSNLLPRHFNLSSQGCLHRLPGINKN